MSSKIFKMMPGSSVCLSYMFKSVCINNGSEQILYNKTASPLADPDWFVIISGNYRI